MAESFFALSRSDQREALQVASQNTGRPAHLLEKDVWVVWTLHTLFESPLASALTFKGGTSLSKAYKVVDRFSEDLDLTCDIRKLIGQNGELPANRSQAEKWTAAVKERLPEWIEENARPVLRAAIEKEGLQAEIEVDQADSCKLRLKYPEIAAGTGYVAPIVLLEFGGRSTGEPSQLLPVVCDMEGYLPGINFPAALPQVMSLARTFWEKATAAHVYCAQGQFRGGERYSRHWHDLKAIADSMENDANAVAAREIAQRVARHKQYFFREKDRNGGVIDYFAAVTGNLRIVPEGEALAALEKDYAAMTADGVMIGNAMSFEQLMNACATLQDGLNRALIEPISPSDGGL